MFLLLISHVTCLCILLLTEERSDLREPSNQRKTIGWHVGQNAKGPRLRFMSSSFPEMCTAFLLFVTIPLTTDSSERSFSKLKLIKTYLRNSMRQERLRNLAILSIEHSMTRNLNFDVASHTFAEQRARKK